MVRTLNYVHVVDDIFRAQLERRAQGYLERNTERTPSLAELWSAVRAMDPWWIALADRRKPAELGEVVRFEFVGGGDGAMTREETVLHVVNQRTYHRGFVGDMLYQVPAASPANDLPVFLRECRASPSAGAA